MWAVVYSFILILANITISHPFHSRILVINDCEKWQKQLIFKKNGYFTLTNNNFDGVKNVTLLYGTVEPDSTPPKKEVTFWEIQNQHLTYSSSLIRLEDWISFSDSNNGNVLVMLPEDFCSGDRFAHHHKFVLYEMILSITPSDNDLSSPICLPEIMKRH